jgi:hypothetical protein
MGRKLGATPLFGKAEERQNIPPIPGVLQNRNGAFFAKQKARAQRGSGFF